MLGALLLAVAFLLGPAAPRPRVQLLVTPSACLAIPGEGCVVRASLLIENPGPDWYCPRVEFQWAEGFTSIVESDCPPYEQLDEEERRWFRSPSRSMTYGPGDHRITVALEQGARRAVYTRTVLVR